MLNALLNQIDSTEFSDLEVQVSFLDGTEIEFKYDVVSDQIEMDEDEEEDDEDEI